MDQKTSERIERIKAFINLEMPNESWVIIWTPDFNAMTRNDPAKFAYFGDRVSPVTLFRMANGVMKQIEDGNVRVSQHS